MFILIVAAETFLAPSLTIKPNVWFLDMQHVTPSLGAVYRLWNDGNQKKKKPSKYINNNFSFACLLTECSVLITTIKQECQFFKNNG